AYLIALPAIYTLRFLYFEFTFLPATALAAAAVAVAGVAAVSRLIVRREHTGVTVAATPHLLILGFGILVIAEFAIHGRSEGYIPYGPLRETEITRILRREIALAPGKSFNGRVATLATSDGQIAGIGWDDMIARDLRHVRDFGSDHRFFG